jgi:hypothetical protein
VLAYETGTFSSPVDGLQKIAAFIAANGWTISSSVADGTGWRLHAAKDGVYVNIRAALTETSASMFDDYYSSTSWNGFALYLGDGYSSAANWKSQSGGPKNYTTSTRTVGAGVSLPSGSVTAYHFFADATGSNIVIVIEKTAGIFSHMGFGTSLQKMGTWTGGPYFFGTSCGYNMAYDASAASPGRAYSAECPGTSGDPYTVANPVLFVRADVDAFTGKWISIGTTTTGANGYTGKTGSSCVPVNATAMNSSAPSYLKYEERLTGQMTGQALLLPVRILAARDSGGFSFLGAIPGVFLSNACAKGYAPGGLYSWGASNYRVFPGPQNYPNRGFAIKQG